MGRLLKSKYIASFPACLPDWFAGKATGFIGKSGNDWKTASRVSCQITAMSICSFPVRWEVGIGEEPGRDTSQPAIILLDAIDCIADA